MFTTITIYSILVWFCIGFFVGLGWALAHWVIAKLTARLG